MIGRAVAGPDGTLRLTANPMADGTYTLTLTLTATDPSLPAGPLGSRRAANRLR